MDSAGTRGLNRGGKGREAFRTISEVADQLDLPQHVLRFWESKFSQVKPLKRGGNRRYYRPDDVTLLTAIKKLLHSDGYTIRGVQKLFKAQGLKATILLALDENGEAAQLASHLNFQPDENPSSISVSAGQGDNAEAPSAQDALSSVLVQLKAIRGRME